MVVFWALSGCVDVPVRGRAPVVSPESLYLDAPDQVLPSGVVGEPYETSVYVTGGVGPYRWEAVDPVPPGLRLTARGAIEGTPRRAGTTTFALVAHDAEGRSKRMLATLSVALVPRTTRCGGHLEGRFEASAAGDGGPDLESPDVAWLAVELPHDATTRIDLVFTPTADATAYVERPTELVGSWDLWDDYGARALRADSAPITVPVDAGTDPSLTGFATQALLPVVVVPREAGRWALDVVCTDGPVFQGRDKYPKRAGEPFEDDYDVFGDNEGVRIWTDDPLPDWVVWDEATGRLSGTAEEVGAWPFTIHARAPDGRHRAESALLGVYETTDVACGERAPVVVSEGWTEGESVRRYDPRGFHVFRLPLDGEPPSSIAVHLTGSDGHYLGLARPNPGWQRFFGQAEEVEVEGSTARVRVAPDTYPASRHFADAGELFFTAASTGTVLDGMEVEVRCDVSPAPDLRGLPVVAPLQPLEVPLRAIGGTGPYRWSADGLPSGLRVSPDGVLSGSTGVLGTHPIAFRVTDRAGLEGTETVALTVGETAGCLGHRVLACGDAVDGAFEAAPTEGDARAPTRTFCVPDTSRDLGLELSSSGGEYVVSFADPGVSRAGRLRDPTHLTWVAEVERDAVIGVPFDAWAWPDRDDYLGRPLLVTLWPSDPVEYTVRVDCPVPP